MDLVYMYMQVFISVYAWMEFICTNPIPKKLGHCTNCE